MDKKRRIKYIDLCKGLGILMVTWGHITKLDNPVDTWAASFKMAIFFVAADTDMKGIFSKAIEIIDAAICIV